MSFYMNFGAVNEGLQAELYKRKKNDAKYEADKAEKERSERRDGPNTGMVLGRFDKNLENMKQHSKAGEILQKELHNRASKSLENPDDKKAAKNYENISVAAGNMKDYYNKSNAIAKHMRRHPDAYKESGIFAETCFIEDDWA